MLSAKRHLGCPGGTYSDIMPSRSSRRSSPRTSTAKSQSVNQKHSQNQDRVQSPAAAGAGKSSASAWAEPPLQDAKPSFEDHGGAPFGVLEDMQALGTRPSIKVKARGKDASKKSSVSKNASSGAAGLASDAHDTPESTPALDAPDPFQPEPSALLEHDQPLPIVDDEKDQDYMPRASKKSSHKLRLSRSAAKSASSPAPVPATAAPKTTAAANASPAPVLASAPASASASASASVPVPPSPAPATKGPAGALTTNATTKRIPQPKLKAIVDSAVARSREVGNPLLGSALLEIYQQSLRDDRLNHLLTAVLGGTVTDQEGAEFKEQVNQAKKRVKARDETTATSTKTETPDPATNGTEKKHLPRKSAPSSELPPRQSIEAQTKLPRPKISLRVGLSRQPAPTKQLNPKMKANNANTESQHRARSSSTSSSLSSLTSNEAENGEDPMDLDLDTNEANGAQTRQMSDAPPGSNTSTNNLTVAKPTNGVLLKRSSAEAEMDEHETVLAAKKQKLNQTIYREGPSKESHVRPDLSPLSRQTRKDPTAPPVRLMANGKASGNREESPLTEVSSSPSSGKGTPRTTASVKSVKKKAKTKQSPTKKQNGNYGDEPNGSGGKESPVDYDGESDNNDFCSACSGSGFLLCCDGCDRAFHFTCLDPPLTRNASELQEPWYCFTCVAKRAQPPKQHRGLFSALLSNVEKRNPTTFSLPQKVREYFDGISTGKDGRFLDMVNSKTRSKVGYDELPDNFKTKDSKGQLILCHYCHLSSMGRREIITCDQCGVHWHLDCLDPPMANPPYRDQWGKKVRDWLCPLHVEHELREMEVPRLAARQVQRDRRIFMRRPRNARVVETVLNRGFVNDGVIEVANDDSDSDSDFYDFEASGIVYRLPEKGIKLDFIDRVKRSRYHEAGDPNTRPTQRFRTEHQPSQLSQDNFTSRSILEQQTALSLIQFSNEQKDLNLSSDQVENLLGALIAEAPADVIQQMLEAETTSGSSKETPEQTAEKQRGMLELLQTLIARKLGTMPE
ncbi:hypothetical protein MBLNU459_g2994t1 [Dothideomycetes sp. NU459]